MKTDEKTEDGPDLETARAKLLEYATANERLVDENSKIEAIAITLLHHVEMAHYHSSSIPDFGLTRAEVARMARRTFAIATRAEILEPGRPSGFRFGPFERDALLECQGHQVKVQKLTPKRIILMPWGKRPGAV